MKIKIPDIPEEGLDFEIEEKIENDSVIGPAHASLRIEKEGAEVLVNGELRAEVKMQCSRCLKEFSRELFLPIEAVYHPLEELKREDQREVGADELNLDFYSGEELDLAVLLKEQIELNISMKPLCNEMCKGICPSCGTDLNVGTCKCDIRPVDPRFQKLKKLLD